MEPSKEYKTVLHVHASNGIDLVWHYKKVSKTVPQDIFNFEQTTILVLFGYLFNSNTFDRLAKQNIFFATTTINVFHAEKDI